jgi:predicted amidohydrolase
MAAKTYGHSLIVDPWGRVLAEAAHDEPAVIVAEIDTNLSAAARKKIPNLKNARDFDIAQVGHPKAALRGAAS